MPLFAALLACNQTTTYILQIKYKVKQYIQYYKGRYLYILNCKIAKKTVMDPNSPIQYKPHNMTLNFDPEDYLYISGHVINPFTKS